MTPDQPFIDALETHGYAKVEDGTWTKPVHQDLVHVVHVGTRSHKLVDPNLDPMPSWDGVGTNYAFFHPSGYGVNPIAGPECFQFFLWRAI